MIQCKGPCHELRDGSDFYRASNGRIQQPCRFCVAQRYRERRDEMASLTATLAAVGPPVVSLSNTDLDLY